MEVILTKSVENLGGKNEVVKVKSGYARNYLFPQSLALPATPGNLKTQASAIKAAAEFKKRRVEEARGLADKISGLSLVVLKKAGKEGKLFGSLTSGEIADLILESTGIGVDKRKVVVPTQLKYTGHYNVLVKLEVGVNATVAVEVTTAEAKAADEAAAAQAAVAAAAAAAAAAKEPATPPEGDAAPASADSGSPDSDAAAPADDLSNKKKKGKQVNEAGTDRPD